ncbi:MAG: PKD domain-containing protein, partial [Bacteroidia bacterium]
SSYAWTFGDGNSSTTTAPTHTYNSSGSYTVTLTATSSNSCTDQVSTSVSIYSLPVASFSANTVCEGTATGFTNGTAGTNSYNWNFGDGTSSTLSGPSKTYGAYGNYNVTLTATSNEGCTDDSTVVVTVNEQPTAAFAATTECSGDSTTFTNNSSGTIATYAWDFDNSSTSTDMSPKVAFTMGGTYDVELTVSTSQGCTDVLSNKITVYSTPTAAYTVSNACLADEVVFTDNGSNGNGALIADREFHFGDGANSFGRKANHTYGNADTFTTAMVVTTVNGCTDTATTDVVIYPMPMVMISGNDTCEFDAINFANNSTIASGTLTSYAWNFGDGNVSTTMAPSHSFDTLGVYNVEMTATSDNGCSSSESISIKVDPKPQALFVATEVCDSDSARFQNHSEIAKGQITYQWTFGDGNISTDEHPWHLFDTFGVYDVTMRVTSNKACATEYTISYEVHAQPIAALPLFPTCLGDSTLIPQEVRDLINPDWKYALRTDDTVLTNLPKGYVYPEVGTYPTSLSIVTPFGCYDSTQTDVVILPVPTLNEWTYTRFENGEMEFNATGDSDTMDITWDFGDGNSASGTVVNYTYTTAGTYQVTCTLTNGSGCTDVITKSVEVFPTGIKEFTESMNLTAYPNPFTNWVKLNYDLNKDAYVKIEIIDMQGRLISTIVDDVQAEGKYIYELNENDLPMATGNAMVKVIVDDKVLLLNLVKLK